MARAADDLCRTDYRVGQDNLRLFGMDIHNPVFFLSAGMGIGLMFWSVAEPVAHYSGWAGTPLDVTPDTPEAGRAALGATLFHFAVPNRS